MCTSEIRWIYRICIVCAVDLRFRFYVVPILIRVFFFSILFYSLLSPRSLTFICFLVWCSITYSYDLNRLFCTAVKCCLIAFYTSSFLLVFSSRVCVFSTRNAILFCYCIELHCVAFIMVFCLIRKTWSWLLMEYAWLRVIEPRQ